MYIHIYIHIYIYIYTHMYTYMYAHTHTHTHTAITRLYMCFQACGRTSIYIYIHLHIHTHTHTHIYIYACMYRYEMTSSLSHNVHTHTRTYTHAHTHTVYSETRSVVEPVGALALAGARQWLTAAPPTSGAPRTVVAVASGRYSQKSQRQSFCIVN